MNPTSKKIMSVLLFLPFLAAGLVAQKTKPKAVPETIVPMEPAYWEYDTAGAEFVTHRNVKAIHIKNRPPLILKNREFSNGTIEYDVELGRGFPGIQFRESADHKNAENFYLRYFGSTSPESRTTLQYATVLDGQSMWDITDEYQAGCTLNIPGWNHVKLMISGKQMKAYVNDMTRPALIVPKLEGDMDKGGISFSGGDVMIANLEIKPGVENLDPAPGYISTYNDTRYLRHWLVSEPIDFNHGKEITPLLPYMGGTRPRADLPDSTTKWTPIAAEDRAVVNLSRPFGGVKNNQRRLVWLKTTIESAKAQERILNLGFSDEIWLFVNGQILYTDKNHFNTPGQKFPAGRCTIENATVRLPLQQGKNEVMVALTNYFFAWAIIARLDDTDGIHFSTK